MDAASNPNPLLIYQTESSLRQRILQELKLIAGLPGDVRKWEEQHPAATTASEDSSETQEYLYSLSERVVKRIRSNQALAHRDLVEHTTTSPPIQSQVNVPAALLDFSDISSSNALILEGQVSSLLPYQSEQLEGYNLANLPKHRIPIYSVQSIFKLDSQEENESKEVSKKGQQTDQGTSWNILKRKYPTMYEREAQACQDQLSDFKQTMLSLIPSTQGEESLPSSIVAVPSMSRAMLPLLKALWRYRMWIGEGWSGDGFGVLEATGRK